MARTSRKIVVIGGSIAGICAAVYARKCGYDVEVLEQHDNAGGLATSWRRGDYTFETCLHWLFGAEVIDVSSPATVIRYTSNWRGSYEGWLLTPGTGYRPLRNTLPGLRNFLIAGHWVMPGGGLPSGLFTARSAVRAVCKADHLPFLRRGAIDTGAHAVRKAAA